MGELSHKGELTGATYGFLKDVLYFQEKFDTDNVVFCWDSRYNKRKTILPSYKQNRIDKYKDMSKRELSIEDEFRKQMRLLRRKYLPLIGYRNIFCQKGFESDDVMASVCNNFTKEDVIIITADKDLFQLISPSISVFNPQKRFLMTYQAFVNEYKIKPIEWIRVKAIAGCSSDNVKGIKGVGEATAIKYLKNAIPVTAKVLAKINSQEGQMIINDNKVLVTLPMEGTRRFKIKKDEISKKGWSRVKQELGITSLRKD
jgi:DNA polymerase-1